MSDILADRRIYVSQGLGNRADLSQLGTNGAPSFIDNWIMQSYFNIGMSYEFDELQQTVTGAWQDGEESIPYPPQARRIDSIAFYQPNGTAIRIRWKDMAYLRRYPAGSATIPVTGGTRPVGPPSIVADYNAQIFVRPYADQIVYTYILDFWAKPVSTPGQDSVDPPYVNQGTADIGGTPLLVPNDWLEIIDLGAILRGHIYLTEREKAQEIQQLLFGFTIPTTNKQVPGLIAQMWNRRQAQAPAMDYNIQPLQPKRKYTNTAG